MTGPGQAELSPRVRRTLRRGPRNLAVRQPRRRAELGEHASAASALAEWHDMTPGEQVATWAALRAWVAWLYDRYELATDDRLPRCWASHPGLVEELYALKAWREEIYGSPQPSGQAARYWHAELRQVLQAATAYAAGCRTGHRGAPHLVAADVALRGQWARAYPLAGVPGIDIAAGRAKRAGALASTGSIARVLDNGDARLLPGVDDYVICTGSCWAPAASGWVQVPGPDVPAQMNGTGIIGGTERWEY